MAAPAKNFSAAKGGRKIFLRTPPGVDPPLVPKPVPTYVQYLFTVSSHYLRTSSKECMSTSIRFYIITFIHSGSTRNTYEMRKFVFTPFDNEMGCILLCSHYPFKFYFVTFLPTFLRPSSMYVHLCLNQKIISTFCLEGQKDKVFYIFARQGPFTKQFTNSRQSRKEHYLVF